MNTRINDSPKIISKINRINYKSYSFGSFCHLNDSTLDTLIDIFERGQNHKPERLNGRAIPQFTSLPEAGPVVIKSYKRGGLISRIIKETYFNIFDTRSEKEFEFLVHAGEAGVSVPTPVAFVSKGYPFYKTWLITEEIKDPISYAQLCLNEEEKALSLIPEISQNIRLLIQNNIHHVDLHIGNVIIDKFDKNYIIDFDRARYSSQNKMILAKKYQQRWTKAVKKHKFPTVFTALHLIEDYPIAPLKINPGF